jgi:hypothetical protein
MREVGAIEFGDEYPGSNVRHTTNPSFDFRD